MVDNVLNAEPCAVKLRVCAEKLSLQFRDIRYAVPGIKGKLKEVLHGVNGQILSGRLTAILGPSGAGKTSLLNVLAGFKTKGVTGSVLVNGVKRDPVEFRTQACYIPQDMALLAQLTIKETLSVAARLKLCSSREKQSQVVSDIMDLLGLAGSKDTKVSHLSGGEHKRLSIGVELITNPPIMLFDEPTSGLDSVSSAQIVAHLRSLASSGRAVACVIHQPSSQLSDLFDDVIVLASGRVLYCGPTNEMLPIFQEEGFLCPQYYNRADFALEVACGERGKDLSGLLKRANLALSSSAEDNHATEDSTTKDSATKDSATGDSATEDIQNVPGFPGGLTSGIIDFDSNNSIYDTYQHYVNTKMLPKETPSSNEVSPLDKVYSNTVHEGIKRKNMYPLGPFSQFWILFRRSMLCNFRNLHLTHIRLACHFLVAVLIGVIYFKIGNEASKIDSNLACIFFFILFLFYMNALPVILSYPMELAVVLREHLNNWYSLQSYYCASSLAHVPMKLICPTLFMSIAYCMTGQPLETTRILRVLLVLIMLVSLAQMIGLVAGALLDPQLALIAVPVTTIPMMLFSGFFLRIPDIPIYLRWLGEVSYFRHTFEAITTSVYGLNRTNLECSDPYCHFKSPAKFLEHLEMVEDNFWINVGTLQGWNITFYIILYLSLKWKIHRSK